MKAFMNIGIKLSRHLRTRLLKPWQSVLGIRALDNNVLGIMLLKELSNKSSLVFY